MKNRTIETGIFKKPVKGPIYLDFESVQGDEISDRRVHGGIDKALYGFSARHYDYWHERYDMIGSSYGWFGENITFDDLDETLIRVGNQYQLGTAIIEVTKPRQPCYKLGFVFQDSNIIKDFWESTTSGIYFKIVQRGEVHQGDAMRLMEEDYDQPTIAEVYKSKWIKKRGQI